MEQESDPGQGWCVPGVARPEAPPEPSAVVRAVGVAVEALRAGPVSGRPVDVAAVLALGERLRGAGLAGLAELDASGQYADDGAASAAVWLRRTQTIGEDTARATVRLAGRVRAELPDLLALLREGATTLEHLRAVAAGTAGLDPDLVRAAQPALVELARLAAPAQLRHELRCRAEAIDPDLARDAARRQHARQGFYADPLTGAGVLLGGSLSPEDGAVLLHGLDLCVQADRTSGDTRSLPARRAAALVDWARQAAHTSTGPGDTLAADAHTVRTHLLITCTPDQLQHLADAQARDAHAGVPGAAGALGRQLDAHAALGAHRPHPHPARAAPHRPGPAPHRPRPPGRRRHPQPRPGHPHRHGRGRHTDDRHRDDRHGRGRHRAAGPPLGATVRRTHQPHRHRRPVRRPGHPRPPLHRHRLSPPTHPLQAHHVRHWLHGGPTDLDNLVRLCRTHHHDHHDRGHSLQHHDGRWLTPHGWTTEPPRQPPGHAPAQHHPPDVA